MLDTQRIGLMLVAIAFYAGDVVSTQRLLAWIGDLGGCLGHKCLLVADHDTPVDESLQCAELARKSFDSVRFITNDHHVSGWIPGSCSLFKTAAIECSGEPFFWLEPDVVPLKSGWIDHIQTAYTACRKPFMGALVTHSTPGWPNPYLEGPAVYPANCWERFKPVWSDTVSWTRACAPAAVPHAFDTPLIHQIWGEKGDPPVFAETGVPGTSTFGLNFIRPTAVLFHRTKDGSLIRLLRKKRGIPEYVHEPDVQTFCHGGDVGDLIYGLCAIKAMGGGNLLLVPHAVREAFNARKAESLLPLLRLQPYLKNADFLDGHVTPFGSEEKPHFVDHNLNRFRPLQYHLRHNGTWDNIAESHLRLFNLDFAHAHGDPWLSVDEPTVVPGKSVIFHRSERYHNAEFPWPRIVERYRHISAFVGSPSEHRAFQRAFGSVPYHRTPTYLDLARVIAGAKLFVGNQSSPYAIAEALKQNAILECCTWAHDCVFNRPNLVVGWNSSIRLPTIQ